MFKSEENTARDNGKKIDAFRLSERDYKLVEMVKTNITCDVDKKTDVVTITVQDQDRLVSAILADSVKQRLQDFIIEYRTSKARLDLNHYEELAAKTKKEYEESLAKYSEYCDANQDIILQTSISERDKLEGDMQLKFNTYNALCTQGFQGQDAGAHPGIHHTEDGHSAHKARRPEAYDIRCGYVDTWNNSDKPVVGKGYYYW